MRKSHFVLLVAVALFIAGLVAGWFARGLTTEQPFQLVASQATKVVLYEGLPHGLYEKGSLQRELETKAIQRLNGYDFYREPLELSDEDTTRLRKILSDPATLRPFIGEKKCGGFHPDYAVEFKQGLARYRVLICFHCGETKIFGSHTEQRNDLQKTAAQALGEILKGYRRNRPPYKEESP